MGVVDLNVMKILYYTHTYFFDCDLPLIKAFRELGHEIFTFVDLPSHSLTSTLVDIRKMLPQTDILPILSYEQFEKYSVFFDDEKTYLLNRPGKVFGLRNVCLRIKFWKMVNKIKPDIIHCTDFVDSSDLFLYLYKRRLVQVVHDPFLHSGEESFRRRINRNVAFKLVEKYVLLNKNQGFDFVKKNHLSQHSIYYNKLGVYECIHLFDNSKNDIISTLPNRKVILFWGRISPYKGVKYLMKAMEEVHQKESNAILVVAGYGKFDFDISIYEKVDYITIINRYLSMYELNSLLSIAHVSVCPYIDATQSGVIMTSYAMGVPVVSTNVGGLPEMVIDGVTGYVVKPKSSSSLSYALLKALDRERNQAFRNNIANMHYKDGELSWSSIAKKYIDIYNAKRSCY